MAAIGRAGYGLCRYGEPDSDTSMDGKLSARHPKDGCGAEVGRFDRQSKKGDQAEGGAG
jgi:hypothetical protein